MPVTILLDSPGPCRGTRVDWLYPFPSAVCPGEWQKQIPGLHLTGWSFSPESFTTGEIWASEHGLVWAILQAHSENLHLSIRPDDV